MDLITYRKGSVLEISMNTAYFKATHIVYFGGRKIFDMGIDSQTVTWTPKEFIAFYSQAYWSVDQVIS
ncbi:MAG: hypothetical protein JXA92_12550 [candidate division Zixibacteria bacterium]|nr:hypothetical protein [candidate division Zixibacteria bacterium]